MDNGHGQFAWKWPEEVVKAALAAYVEVGLSEASRRTQIPKPTIAMWAKQHGVLSTSRDERYAQTGLMTERRIERAREQRLALRERMVERVHDLLDRMDAPHIDFVGKDGREVIHPIAPAQAVKDYAISVGVLIDKMRLESGEANIVTGTTDVLPDIDDHEREVLAQVLRDAIAQAEAATETVPDGADG
jgi:hypothetical protein